MLRTPRNERGFLLPMTIIVALLLSFFAAIIISRVQREGRSTTDQSLDLKAMDLADAGIQAAVARLRQTPNDRTELRGEMVGIGKYRVAFYSRGTIDPSAAGNISDVMIVSTGSVVSSFFKVGVSTSLAVGSGVKVVQAYVRVSNPGDFFAASAGDLSIRYGTDLRGAKVYGRRVNFTGPPANTMIQDLTTLDGISDYGAGGPAFLKNSGSCGNPSDPTTCAQLAPRDVDNPMVFPVLDSARMDYYESLGTVPPQIAGQYTLQGTINGPPHVYYAPGDIHVSGEIVGQVVIVAGGNIIIDGDVTRADPTDPDTPGPHQAVLFSARDIILRPTSDDMRVDGYLMAPNGRLQVDQASPIRQNFTLNGGMMVRDGADVASRFSGARTYNYDSTFSSSPPPFMPYTADVVRWRLVSDYVPGSASYTPPPPSTP